MADKVRVGVVGCGAISGAYFKHAQSFPILEMAACADINMEAAKKKGEEFGIASVCTVDELLADPAIDVVLNLTVPKAHYPIAMRCIEAGKHTYAEKPLGISRDQGKQIITAAKKAKVKIGCAPDTVLGAGIQTARKLLDEGAIGRPVGFTAFMMCPGHESWHPSPEFYYEVGGGPMFDMGPYYLTALLNLLGPVARIGGMAAVEIAERTITSQPKFGKKVKVETPDHIMGTMEFASGAVGSIAMSFATRFPTHGAPITIFGTEGTMKVPDPNAFDGDVFIRTNKDQDWQQVPHAFVKGYGRAVGLADMAYSIRAKKRRFRCDGQQAFAVLDLMQGFLDAAASGRHCKPKAKYERPAPMPTDLPFGTLDE